MSDLIQSVTDGVVDQSKRSQTQKGINNELGKDAFLKLLTTQMKYQDPLNPNTDTEYIAQLATFSQLEQMQNISTISTNSQAFSLVGKDVIVKTETSTGDTKYVSGRVDFVNMTGGKAKISVNGNLYSIDNLDSVIDGTYILEQGLPGVLQKTSLTFDFADAKDQTFAVRVGEGETVADDAAIQIGNKILDNSLVSIKDGKVIIKKEALAGLKNGVYKLTVIFNDPLYTTVNDMVTLTVKNSTVTEEEETPKDESDASKPEENSDKNEEEKEV
jgi:flagellar basal-body rod modification protein FlgD